jgi:hypothetical protein
MTSEARSTPEDRAAKRVKAWTGLMWHIAAYVIVNAFLWFIVPAAAFWVTIGWGIGLAFHIAAFVIGDDGPDNRRYQKYLAEERAADERAAEDRESN